MVTAGGAKAALRVTIWNEFRHEQTHEAVRSIYPQGIHMTLAHAIKEHIPGAEIRTATLEQPEHGLTDEVLNSTDVLVWWAHMAHEKVLDAVVDKVHARVLSGMGVLFLHSAHYSKPFKKLMGTGCGLKWREAGERERLFVVAPAHEIADGLPEHFEIPHEEMYGEFFDVPTPEEVVMISWFEGGNVFRSCCTWTRGKGRVAYFRPGHETFPTYHQKEVQKVVANAIVWARPKSNSPYALGAPNETVSLSPISTQHIVDATVHQSQEVSESELNTFLEKGGNFTRK